MNPTNEHREQAREIVGSCVVDGDVAPSGRLYITVAEETITDRIAAALSVKDIEIGRLKDQVLATIDGMKGKLAHRNQLLTDIAAVLRDLFLKEGIEVK